MGSLSGVWAVFCWVRTPFVSGISFPPLAPGTAQALSLWRAWVPYGGAWGLEILSRTPFFPFPFLPSQSPAAWMLRVVFCWMMVMRVETLEVVLETGSSFVLWRLLLVSRLAYWSCLPCP